MMFSPERCRRNCAIVTAAELRQYITARERTDGRTDVTAQTLEPKQAGADRVSAGSNGSRFGFGATGAQDDIDDDNGDRRERTYD